MGKTKEAKVKKPRNSASRNSFSSRPGLERAVSQADPPGSTADGPDDDAASVLSRSSSGGERGRGNTKVFSKHRSHGTPGPKSPARRPSQRSTPARSQASGLAGKYGARAVSQVIPSGSNSVDDGPPPGVLPWERYRRIDPFGLNQNFLLFLQQRAIRPVSYERVISAVTGQPTSVL